MLQLGNLKTKTISHGQGVANEEKETGERVKRGIGTKGNGKNNFGFYFSTSLFTLSPFFLFPFFSKTTSTIKIVVTNADNRQN